MTERTCSEDGCPQPIDARGLCRKHYGARWRLGEFRRQPRPHQITNPDPATKLGDCATCGPDVSIRYRTLPSGNVTISCWFIDHGRKRRGSRKPREPRQSRQRSGSSSTNWRKYGITDEEFGIRLAAQQGRCLICALDMDKPMVDHDHDRGHVRGLLCLRCNAGLGFFGDNPEALATAAKYVRRYMRSS